MKVKFLWKAKKCEDFVVKEVASYPNGENHFLYLLVKRNLNTKELSKKLGFSYAGLKDKFSLSFQYVSFEYFFKESELVKVSKSSWYYLKFIKTIKNKVRPGFLQGNKFLINIKNFPIKSKIPQVFINYFDTQRLSKNVSRGKNLLKKGLKGYKRLNWLKSFIVNAYISYLWNKAIEEISKIFDGYYIEDKGYEFFILKNEKNLFNIEKMYFPLLGYKVKLDAFEKEIYKKVLKREGFSLEEIFEKLENLKVKGDYRKVYIQAKDIKLLANKTFIKFFLEKGAYATMFLKHLQAV